MSKKSFRRLIRIVTGTFGSGRDDAFAVEHGLTRLERFAHFWVLVWQSFRRNRCPVRASALSYTTLLALIPMLAVAMSVSSFFLKSRSEQQIKAFVEQFIEHLVPDQVSLTNASSKKVWVDSGTEKDSTGSSPTNFNAVTVPIQEEEPIAERTNAVALLGKLGDDLFMTNGAFARAAVSVLGTNAASPIANRRIDDAKQRAADTLFGFIQTTQSGALGIVAVLFLLWTAILMLTRVEETFNDIWGVTQGRNWLSRIVLYWAAMTLGTMLIMAAIGLASGPYFEKTRSLLGVVPYLETLLSTLLPVVIICVTFTLFYKLVPNTRVNFSAALVGGALAGTAWHLFNVFSIHLATRGVTADKFYGSLALLPLLMMGLYIVWVIILFGAQVAYAFQNRESYLQECLADNVNQRGREFVALRLMTCIGQRFDRGLPPPTTQDISRELGIPSKLVQQVLHTLLAARLVVEVAGVEHAYAPARPLEAINAHHVLIAMRATHGQDFITHDEPVRAEIYGEFARIQAAEQRAASVVTMLALVNRAHPQTSAPGTALIEAGMAPDETASPATAESTVAESGAGIPQPTDVSQNKPATKETPLARHAPAEESRPAKSAPPDTSAPVVGASAQATTNVPTSSAPETAKTNPPQTPFATATNDDNETFPL